MMHSRATGLSMSVVGLLAAGCVWRTHEEERQMQARCYIRPVGQTAGTTITLEGKRTYTFSIGENRDRYGDRYGMEPDTYKVTVRHDGKIVLQRMLFIADGETRELSVR